MDELRGLVDGITSDIDKALATLTTPTNARRYLHDAKKSADALTRLADALPPASGVDTVTLIAAERARQVSVEGWNAAHDDAHTDGELAAAASSYAWPELKARGTDIPAAWPWESAWWKPTPDDRIRELVKAGALIVAEIERLQRTPTPEASR